jgi:hypothetical protein
MYCMTRDAALAVRMTEESLADLKERAWKARLSQGKYIEWMLEQTKDTVTAPDEDKPKKALRLKPKVEVLPAADPEPLPPADLSNLPEALQKLAQMAEELRLEEEAAAAKPKNQAAWDYLDHKGKLCPRTNKKWVEVFTMSEERPRCSECHVPIKERMGR